MFFFVSKINDSFHVPSTQFVDRNAIFFVSKGFSLEKLGVRV